MNKQVTKLKLRTKSDIETDFIPAIATINAISEMVFETTKEADSDFLECLPPQVMHNLADRITIESDSVKQLFYELWETGAIKDDEIMSADDKNTRFKPVDRGDPLCVDTQAEDVVLVDKLNIRFDQLYAMTTIAPDSPGKIQDGYRWALSDMVEETRALFEAYSGQK